MATNTSIELVKGQSDSSKVKCIVVTTANQNLQAGESSNVIGRKGPITRATSVTSVTRRRASVISKVLPRQISKPKVVLGDVTKTPDSDSEQHDPER